MKEWFKPNTVGDYAGAIFLMVVFFLGIVIFWKKFLWEKILISGPACWQVGWRPL